MNCPDFQQLLQRQLDGHALSDQADLPEHLAGCAECRVRHAAALRLAEGLRLLARPQPLPGLASRIVRNVLADRRSALRLRRRLLTAASVAAALVLVAFALYQGQRQSPATKVGDTPPWVRNNDLPRREKDPPVPRDSRKVKPPEADLLDHDLKEASATAVAWTRRAAGETVADARRWLPPTTMLSLSASPLKGGDNLAPVLEPLASSFRQAGRGVSVGLQPVTSSAPRLANLRRAR